jgi:hypothetical protein
LGIQIPENATPLINFSFSILILTLISLLCFINVTGYLTSIYLINKYNIEIKFPKYKKIIQYFESYSLFFILIEIILCLLCLLFIIYVCLRILDITIFRW